MPSAAVKRYWEWLANEFPRCVCGSHRECFHHIIHVNRQRITKDDMLVVGLCTGCHQTGKYSVHQLGGERQFLEVTGLDLVQLAVLRRHNFEIRNG